MLTLEADREYADILSVVSDRCELKSLADDKNGRLDENAKQDAFGAAISWYSLGISSDGKYAAVRVQVGALPSIGATKLNASGKIALIVGKTKAASKVEALPIAEGSKVKAGDIVLSIKEIHKSEDAKAQMVVFQFEGYPRQLIELDLHDKKGERIERDNNESSIITIQPDGKSLVKLVYYVPAAISEVDIKTSYWNETEEIDIAFNTSTNLGLAK